MISWTTCAADFGDGRIFRVKNELHTASDFEFKMPPPPIEAILGSMGVLRQKFVAPGGERCVIRIESQMFLALRQPRLETTVMHPAPQFHQPNFDIEEIYIGDKLVFARKNIPEDLAFGGAGPLFALIRPGEFLTAVMRNTSVLSAESNFVIEGDEVRELHWGVHCKKDCSDCRWRTKCHHDECECMPEFADACSKAAGSRADVQLVTREDVPGAPVLQAFQLPEELPTLMRFDDVPQAETSAFGTSGVMLPRRLAGPDGPLTPAALLGRRT